MGFAPRLEGALLAVFAAGLGLIAQTWVEVLYRAGLLMVMGSALLIIAVGNVPRRLRPSPALLRAGMLLVLLASVFAAGYLLVPRLATLGQ